MDKIMDKIEDITNLEHAKAIIKKQAAELVELDKRETALLNRIRTFLEGFERQKDIAEEDYKRHAVTIAIHLKSPSQSSQRDIAYIRFKEAKATYDNLEQVIMVINRTY
jgi:hypothetical protein